MSGSYFPPGPRANPDTLSDGNCMRRLLNSLWQPFLRIKTVFTQTMDALWGYDVFIAHRAVDAKGYSKLLSDALVAEKMSCFFDQIVYTPGDSLRVATQRHASKTTVLVVIGSPELLVLRKPVDWVEREIATYLTARGRDPRIVVIDFGGVIENALLAARASNLQHPILDAIEDFIRLGENSDALSTTPSSRVLDAIRRHLHGRRRDTVRLRAFQFIAGLLAFFLLGAVLLGNIAWDQKNLAEKSLTQSLQTDSRRLAIESGRILEAGVPDLAAAMAREALIGTVPGLPNVRRPYSAEAGMALFHALARRPLVTDLWPVPSLRHAVQSPDGNSILAGLFNGEALVLHPNDVDNVKRWKAHTKSVDATAYSATGKRLATGSSDGSVKIWDASSLDLTHVLRVDPSIRTVSFGKDGDSVVTVGGDDFALLFRLFPDSSSQQMAYCRKDPATSFYSDKTLLVESAALSPNGRDVALGCEDGTVQIFEFGSLTEPKVLRHKEKRHAITSLSYSPSGRLIAAGNDQGDLMLLDVENDVGARTLSAHQDRIMSLVFNKDGNRLLSASRDANIALWSVSDGKRLQTMRGHAFYVLNAEFASNDTYAVSSSWDNSIRFWKLDNPSAREIMREGLASAPLVSQASTDGNIAVGNSAGVSILHSSSGALVNYIPFERFVTAVTLSKNGNKLAVATATDEMRPERIDVLHAGTGAKIAQVPPRKDEIAFIDFRRDGEELMAVYSYGAVRFLNTDSGQLLAELPDDPYGLNSAKYSPDGDRIVVASYGRAVSIWDRASLKRVVELTPESQGYVGSVNFDPTGSRVVVANSLGETTIFDAATGNVLLPLLRQKSGVNSAEFSPNGSFVVTACDDGTVTLFEAGSGRAVDAYYVFDPVASDDKPMRAVTSAKFSADGKEVVVAVRDGSLRIWRPEYWTDQDIETRAIPGRVLTWREKVETNLD